jgi:hypothetical protein
MFLKSFVNKLRYLVWASPIVWLALLNGCGSGSVLDPFVPTRIIAFGDAFMDTRSPRFTVNDEIPSVTTAPLTNYSDRLGPLNNSSTISYVFQFNPLFYINGYLSTIINQFAPAVTSTSTSAVDTAINPELTVIERIAADYGFGTAVLPMSTIFAANHNWSVPSDTGVYSFAEGNALVTDQAGTASGDQQSYAAGAYTGSLSPARSIQSQINMYLRDNGGSFSANDLIIVNGGTADILWSTLGAGAPSVTAAATNLVSQVNNVLGHGAKHVVVFGPPNLGRSPFATANSIAPALTNASLTLSSGGCNDFNCALELGIQRLVGTVSQNPVLYIDISSQSSNITGTVHSGTSNTFAVYTDPLYGAPALSYPGENVDTTMRDPSAASGATDANYYCNQTNIGVSNPFFITSTPTHSFTGVSPTLTPAAGYCYANPKTPLDYRSYAYADAIYFTPSVNRMLGDWILSKLRLASWR